jgi:hypothetical protein
MIDVRLNAIRQVHRKYAIPELVNQIEWPGSVDLIMRRVVAQSKRGGVQIE